MERLRKRADFLAAGKGTRIQRSAFVLQAHARRDNGASRVGFTVSKKVGNAVERNRVRRRLREMVRQTTAQTFRQGYDYVVIGRRTALNLPFAEIAQDFAEALHCAHASGKGADAYRKNMRARAAQRDKSD